MKHDERGLLRNLVESDLILEKGKSSKAGSSRGVVSYQIGTPQSRPDDHSDQLPSSEDVYWATCGGGKWADADGGGDGDDDLGLGWHEAAAGYSEQGSSRSSSSCGTPASSLSAAGKRGDRRRRQKVKLRFVREVEATMKAGDLECDPSTEALARQCERAFGRALTQEEEEMLNRLGSGTCAFLAQRASQQ